ncbi:4a-hydroxytetrahydrobiopterin dehydratase [Candidatus Poribacteria bacterium]|nr:4a-hydroxytetrahydrobiopterin dehydratase [Candidatus Poribacteria bacterium]
MPVDLARSPLSSLAEPPCGFIRAKETIPLKEFMMSTAREKDVLNLVEIEEALTELDGWEYNQGKLTKTYTLGGFSEGVDFLAEVSKAADEINHHPDVLLTFKKLKFSLWTHRFDGITRLDTTLAGRINQIGFQNGMA